MPMIIKETYETMIRNYTVAQNKQKHAASCCTQHGAWLYLFFQQCLLPVPAAHEKQLSQCQNCQYPLYGGECEARRHFFLSLLNKCPSPLNFGMLHLRGQDLGNEQGEPLPLLARAQPPPCAAAVSTLSAGDPKSRAATERSPRSWPVPLRDLHKPLPPFPT